MEEILVDDNNFKALFYQDAEMHLVYHTYPELIMVDTTYKLINLRLPARKQHVSQLPVKGQFTPIKIDFTMTFSNSNFKWKQNAISSGRGVARPGHLPGHQLLLPYHQ